MIRCFRSSKLVIAAALVVSAALCVAVFLVRSDVVLWINIVTALLVLALGLAVGGLIANMVASNANSKLLGILYVQLDPERFISAYREVPGKLAKGSYLRTVTSSYLAAGYAAKGDYALARQTLFCDPAPTRSEKSDLALKALIHDNLCEFALLDGDAQTAKSELSALRDVLKRAQAQNPELVKNYDATLSLYEQWLPTLSGKTADVTLLDELAKRTPVQLRRLEMQSLSAQSYARRGKTEQARDAYNAIIKAGGSTHFTTDAEAALCELESAQ